MSPINLITWIWAFTLHRDMDLSHCEIIVFEETNHIQDLVLEKCIRHPIPICVVQVADDIGF